MTMSAGKGDLYRKVNRSKYEDNYNQIKWKQGGNMIEWGHSYGDNNKVTRIVKTVVPRGFIEHKEFVPAFTNKDKNRKPIGRARIVAPVNHPYDYYITIYLDDDDPRVEQILTPVEITYNGEQVFINYVGERDMKEITW